MTFLGLNSIEQTEIWKASTPFWPLRDDTVVRTHGLTESRVFRRLHAALIISDGDGVCQRNCTAIHLTTQTDFFTQFTRQLNSHSFCWDCDSRRLLYSAARPYLSYLLTM